MDHSSHLSDIQFMPHGHCYFWVPEILWPHVIGDVVTAISYYLIPFYLIYIIKKRKEEVPDLIFYAFAAFIFICGTSHILTAISVWNPLYRIEAVVKVLMAIVSMGTVVLLIKGHQKLLNFPTPFQMSMANQNLQLEINQRKKAEAAINSMNQNLEIMVKQRTSELEVAYKELETYTYAITHDLRQPLTNLVSLSQMLETEISDKLDEEGHYVLNLLIQNAEKTDRLILNLLNYAYTKNSELEKKEINMNQLFEEAIESQKVEYDNKNLLYKIADLPNAVGDKIALRQVCINLVSNAFKYSSKNKTIEIKIGAERQPNETVYWIKDNGVGFDEQYKHKVFEVFKRLHGKDFKGIGMGMPICKNIIEKHGGRIWTESQLGKGAVFYFTLPTNS